MTSISPNGVNLTIKASLFYRFAHWPIKIRIAGRMKGRNLPPEVLNHCWRTHTTTKADGTPDVLGKAMTDLDLKSIIPKTVADDLGLNWDWGGFEWNLERVPVFQKSRQSNYRPAVVERRFPQT